MPKCTINGKEIEVKDGTSIIQAMRDNGMEIAHYCWHPGLSVAGVCRVCMVEIEGNPRVQIACNTNVTEGMKINNTSAKVKDAVKWGLDFHLINHPLDCPICDQAGECGLQDQYMHYGQYESEMAERKVKKHKVIDLGPTVVLDSERCILCSRCVRFTEEVSKTNELGIFNRGDRSEIGTFEGKPLDNNYSLNTVDICPVGALTSKDFRFRQRVWFLKESETICTGCSTGCNVKVYHNKEGMFRVKPVYNAEVNGYWMCDKGRDIYKYVNKEHRLLDARVSHAEKNEYVMPALAAKKVGEALRAAKSSPKSLALVITGQYTVEELDAMVAYFKKDLGCDQIYHWMNSPEKKDDFDGLLLRGDRNPNTKGLLEVFAKHQVTSQWSELEAGLNSQTIQTLVVAGPENYAVFSDVTEKASLFAKAKHLVWLTACKNQALETVKVSGQQMITQIPLKTFIEKGGSFVNYKGIKQTVKAGATVVEQALTLVNVAHLFAGLEVDLKAEAVDVGSKKVKNYFTGLRGEL